MNSPLLKTAVHGADPNCGRVAMAIGKCEDDRDIIPERVRVAFGDFGVYPRPLLAADLADLTAVMRSEHVSITVDLGFGIGSARVWGCELSAGYIAINAEYST